MLACAATAGTELEARQTSILMRFPLRIWLALAAPALVSLGLTALAWRSIGPRGAIFLGTAAALVVAAFAAWRWNRDWGRPLARLESIARQLARGEAAASSGLGTEIELGPLAQALDELSQRANRQVADARAEGDHLRMILASVPEGILVTDAQGRAELVNPAFIEMFRAVEPVAGRSPLELSRHPVLHDLVERTLTGEGSQHGEITLDDSDRRELHLSVLELPQRAGVVLLARDVTAEHRLAEMRRDFVANVSHELKTPLAAIRGYAETLRDGALDEPQTATPLRRARSIAQARRLQALLDDLLTLSRLESRRPAPASGSRSTWRSLRRARRRAVAPLAQERDVELALDSGGPLRVRRRQRRPRAPAAQPARQRDQVQPAGRHGASAAWSAARAPRSSPSPTAGSASRRGAAADLRALLPRRQGALARGGRHRAGPRDRQARRPEPRRPGRGRERVRQGHDVPRGAAAGLSACSPVERVPG